MSRRIEQRPPAACHALEVDASDLRATDRAELERMAFLLFLVRDFEMAVLDLKDADLIHGPAHTSVGQEAVAAGMAVALRKGDMVGSTHRAHGHFVSKAVMYYAPDGYRPLQHGVTAPVQDAVNRTLAEIMGLYEGWCRGRGGSMHLYDAASGNLGSNAIVGGGIPLATGAAWAEKLRGRDTVVVSVFGDGAINQGCFHEVANMAALWDVPILYLVENNFYAVGTGTPESSCIEDLALRSLGYGIDSLIVDGMDPLAMYIAIREAAEAMRSNPHPFFIEAKTYRHFHHAGRLPGSAFGYRSKDEEAEWRERDPIETFPQRLIAAGLMSAGELQQLRDLARASIDAAVAFCTEEREGSAGDTVRVIPAAKWPPLESLTRDVRCEEDVFEGVRFIEREDVDATTPMAYVGAIAGATRRAMERDERVIVLGEEVANLRGGAYQATRGIKEVFPERLINTPISETGFIGMAGGAASVGMRPVVEVMFPDFALMASDQLFNQIGKLRHMYGGNISFPLIVRTRVAIGFGYGGQHSMDPGSFFAQFSGWRIMAPSNAFDYVGMFNTAMRFEDPVLMLEHGMLYDSPGEVPAEGIDGGHPLDYYVPYGKARVVREGTDVTVLTYLTGVAKCLQAAEALAAEGIRAEVIDLRTLDYIGMDYEAIGRSLIKTGSLLIVEEGPRSLTLGARIADEVQERFFDYLDCPVGHVTAPDVPSMVSRVLEQAFIPSVEQIQQQMAVGARHAF
ncbi:MAG TPA: MFS transporter [Chloroflexi bacterium]|jgi:2-oxoisovalerate dehydrogenase E1 component|nr:MFS transporter [Chloroflexota bacterium]